MNYILPTASRCRDAWEESYARMMSQAGNDAIYDMGLIVPLIDYRVGASRPIQA